jgi:hypothetical protein
LVIPLIGLIRDKATGKILATWNFPTTEDAPPLTVCPYIHYTPARHEIVDLSESDPATYLELIDKHHTKTMSSATQGGWQVKQEGTGHIEQEIGPKGKRSPPGGTHNE